MLKTLPLQPHLSEDESAICQAVCNTFKGSGSIEISLAPILASNCLRGSTVTTPDCVAEVPGSIAGLGQIFVWSTFMSLESLGLICGCLNVECVRIDPKSSNSCNIVPSRLPTTVPVATSTQWLLVNSCNKLYTRVTSPLIKLNCLQ